MKNPVRAGAALSEPDAYHELCCYTLAHRDPGFIHQHVVDAFAAQAEGPGTSPVGMAGPPPTGSVKPETDVAPGWRTQ